MNTCGSRCCCGRCCWCYSVVAFFSYAYTYYFVFLFMISTLDIVLHAKLVFVWKILYENAFFYNMFALRSYVFSIVLLLQLWCDQIWRASHKIIKFVCASSCFATCVHAVHLRIVLTSSLVWCCMLECHGHSLSAQDLERKMGEHDDVFQIGNSEILSNQPRLDFIIHSLQHSDEVNVRKWEKRRLHYISCARKQSEITKWFLAMEADLCFSFDFICEPQFTAFVSAIDISEIP